MKKWKYNKNFEAVNDEDVIKEANLDEKLWRKNGHISCIERDYNEFKLQYDL